MASVSVLNMDGKEVEKLDINDAVFAAPINEHLLHKAATLQLANRRQGTQKAKTRSEVRGGVASLGDRRVQDMQDRVPSVHHSGQEAEWYLHRYRENMDLR